ncbi:DUF6300 family protein [Spirillospora sp. NBC_01491]|uniref:DUF6300 family protein n=1 Tax=Spirillospora sp. NBC_01491 TaxID=2976007 RepID=UPI003FA7EB2A
MSPLPRRGPPPAGRIHVVSAPQPPTCPRCGGEGLASARVPHDVSRADGHKVKGTTVVVLCPRCDAHRPAAGALITFFAVYGTVESATVDQCARLLQAWTNEIVLLPADTTAIDVEAAAWRTGEL